MRNLVSRKAFWEIFLLLATSVGGNAAILQISPANQTIISGQTAQFSAQITGDATPPFLFSWAGPSGFYSHDQSINVTSAGKYSVTARDSAGQTFGAACGTLNVKQLPTVTVANDTLTCSRFQLTLHANTSARNAIYSWTGPGIVSGANTSNLVVNLPGTYTVTVTALNGCTASVSAEVNEDKAPPPLVVATPGVLSATNPFVVLQAFSSTNVGFLWTGPGIVSGSNSASCTVSQPGVYTVTAALPLAFGLAASGSITLNGTNVTTDSYNPPDGPYYPGHPTNSVGGDTNILGGINGDINLGGGIYGGIDQYCSDALEGAIVDQNGVTNFVNTITAPSLNGHFSFHYDETLWRFGLNGCNSTATVVVEADSTFIASANLESLSSVKISPGAVLTPTQNGNQIILAWPTNQVGFTLQSALDSSAPESWVDSTNPPVIVGTQFVVTNAISGPAQFYRLKK